MKTHSFGARAVFAIASLQLALGPQAVLAQTAPAAGVAPPTTADARTTVGSSANGTPVVNIATPNAAGVSHNRYNTYDVSSRGLILNNSATNAVSLLGGGVAGNSNLAAGPAASLILNEVVAPNAGSMLSGYQEVLGQSAELVLANPYGITCNGCGFINTPRVTLTTGVPTLSAGGSLAGFTITGGQIVIGADGLDASRQQTLDLLARGISVGGNIVVGSTANAISGDLQLLGGSNEFNYATRAGTAIAGSGAAPSFAIDSSALGGMYANRIRLLVNENGAGVRVAGGLAAFADDLTIAANGRIELRGAASAARDLTISGTDILTALADSNTWLYGGRDFSLSGSGALNFGTGSLGALRNFSINGASLLDAGGGNDLRLAGAGGALNVGVTGDLSIGGGYWTAPRLSFSGANAEFGSGAVAYGSASSGTALDVTTPGVLSVNGAQLYSNADAALNAQRLETDSHGVVAATKALNVTVGRGGNSGNNSGGAGGGSGGSGAGGIDNAGVLQGDTVSLVAAGAAPTSPTTFHNAASGQILANGALSISESGAPSSAGSVLTNDGVIAADTVTVDTGTTTNTNAIQATTTLALNSDRLENTGKDALIIGSTAASGTASIAASAIANSGTIWSAGDLTLSPFAISQQRAAGATSNPLIGAGRDLTIAFHGGANLGAGDLQAGRDLTITGTTVTDLGRTAVGGTTGDLRSAGRNLSATATSGDAVIAGGQWFANGNLDLTGENVTLGRYFDPQLNTYTFSAGLQLIGAQSGTGAIGLTARSGSVALASDTGVFSGGDLNIAQSIPFILPQYTSLQANGALSISAATGIDNYGKIFGRTISLSSSNGLPFDYTNRATGVLFADDALHIGSAAAPAGTIGILASAPGAQAGMFGGVLDINSNLFLNNGTVQGVGAGSVINATLVNNNGQIQGYADAAGHGGLTINTTNGISNQGVLFDSTNLTLNTANLSNYQGASIASPGHLSIFAGTVGAQPVYNLGTIGGYDLDLQFGSGLINGLDPGVPANRTNRADIFATHRLGISVPNGATLTNYATIESDGDLAITYNAGGTLSNQMSMIPASELMWTPGFVPATYTYGDFGLLTQGQNGATDKHFVNIDGQVYYYFGNDLQTQAYLSRQLTIVEDQTFATGVDPAAIPRPTIRAGNDLSITGFGQVQNNGTIEAARDVTIQSTNAGSTVQNNSLYFGQRDNNSFSVEAYTCRHQSPGIPDVDWGCGVVGVTPNKVEYNGVYGGYTPTVTYTNYRNGNVAFGGKVFAGGALNVSAGNVSNSGTPQQFQGGTVQPPTKAGTGPITPAGTVSSRAGANTLTVNGAQIPLPTSPTGGRFVAGSGSGTTPLIETNPIFGIDSIALGSDYLVKLLGLNPDQQTRRLGDDNYEAYLIQQQVKAETGRSVLQTAWNTADMVQTLFDNAATEAKSLGLGFGKALTPEQVASLKSDIVWLVEQEVQGQKVLVPVVYLTDATRAAAQTGNGPTLAGYNVNLEGGTVTNTGADIVAANRLNIKTTGDISNISGRLAGWNVQLDAGGDIVNSTLVTRVGDAQNGQDVAQRVASIEAGNTAVLKAGRDINVNGAWVSAGKDAALIAGRNVNVNALALTANTKTGDADNGTTTQQQTALGAGIVAGGDALLRGGQDVNLKGAELTAGGTAAVRADNGNVNIGVLELQNSQSTSSSKTGLYTQLDTDKKNASATLGIGVEKKTTTDTTATTTGVGSKIAGNGVFVSTGKGDVNLTGSSIEAGKDGAVIDSARDVNIAAYNDKTESSHSTNRTRVGVQLDASADEVLGGGAQSGDKVTTTQTDTAARVSGIKSTGNIVIQGKGTVTNEGTALDAAGDIALLADNVVNKAARNTSTTTTTEEKWETKEQEGLTTNGTGASINNAVQNGGKQVSVNNLEYQQRLTASYSTQTDTTSASQAVTTQVKSGGNVVVNARNNASDEGTQYSAGKNIVISAENYENKAAADTTTTTSERTYGSGKASVGINTSVEVAVNASAEGGHTKSGDETSTARTGSLAAGGNVILQARSGDVTLEGTQIDGAHGVGISAGRDININQANDTTTHTSSEKSGSGRLSASVSLIGTGGSVGAGASTRLADSTETTSKAKTANIKSGGDVQLDAGRDLTSQGVNVDAGKDVALKAGRDINLLAATDKTDKTGSVDAGGADVNVGFGTGAAKGNGGVSASVDFERGRTDYHETTQAGSTIKSGGTLSVDAGGNARLQGTQVDANAADLKTGGNLTLESAKHTITDNSYDVGGHVELSASKGGGTGGANSVGQGSSGSGGAKGGNAAGGNAGVNVTTSKQDVDTNTNARINTRGGTKVDVGGDLSLKGANIDAQGGVSGKVAGNLNVETRTDKENVDQKDVKAYAGIAPVGGSGGGSKFQRGQEGVQAAANNIGQTGVFTDVNATSKDNLSVGTASGISGGKGGIDLTVGGNTALKGAANSGTDFKTQGQTTIDSVETRTKESSTKFRVAGTVSTLAGSDQGKGGDFSAGLNLPESHGEAPNAPKRAGANGGDEAPQAPRPRVNGADEPNAAPRQHEDVPQPGRPVAPHVQEDAPLGDNYANIDRGPAVRPRAGSQPGVIGNGDAPLGDNYANIDRGSAPGVRPRSNSTPAPVANADAPLGDNYANGTGNRVPAPIAPPARPRANSEPVLPSAQRSNLNDAQHAEVNGAPRPQDHNAPYVGAREPAQAQDHNAPYVGAREPAQAPVNANEHLALAHPAEGAGQPAANAPLAHVPPDTHVVREFIAQDPQAEALRTRNTHLDAIETRDFERNLAEIVAFKEDGRHTERAEALLGKIAESLNGPREHNGFTEFPLRPQYVGENEPGFNSWKTRDRNEPIGQAYQENGTPPRVRYFTPEEQERNRVYVGPDGKLTFGNGPLPQKTWLFVVDREGRLIATPYPKKEDLLHHSSLSGGEPVRLAGKFRTDAIGNLITIENESGHFRPSQAAFERFLVDLKAAKVIVDPNHVSAPAYEYIAKANNQYEVKVVHQNLLKESRIQNGAPSGLASLKAPRTFAEALQQPEIIALQQKGSAFAPKEKAQFERNLEEIVAFTNEPEYAANRPKLLDTLETSLKGPRDRGDGVKLFPVRPEYVGENVKGFNNWNARGISPTKPGALYQQGRHLPEEQRERDLPQSIVYYTPEQQKKAQVFVGRDGQLTFANGKLADGDWIFVVDQNGRIIASPPVVGRIHHSSLAAGQPVTMAGTIYIENGRLHTITNSSGHFRPDTDAFRKFLGNLQRERVDLRGVTAEAYELSSRDIGFESKALPGNLLEDRTYSKRGPVVLNGLRLPAQAQANANGPPVSHPVPELLPQVVAPAPDVQPVANPAPAVQPVANPAPAVVRPVGVNPQPQANPQPPVNDQRHLNDENNEDDNPADRYNTDDAPAPPPANDANAPIAWLRPAARVWGNPHPYGHAQTWSLARAA
jgi:filamentous hemagglutinin